jgi:hypothetical protein
MLRRPAVILHVASFEFAGMNSLPSTESVRGDASSGRFVDPSGRSETQETPADVGLAFFTGLGAFGLRRLRRRLADVLAIDCVFAI